MARWFNVRSKRRAGTRQTEVRLDGWYEGVVGQQRLHDNARRSERVEIPGSYITK